MITKGNFGGAQRYVFDLATYLPKDRFDVAVAYGEGESLGEKLGEHGVRTIKIGSSRRNINIFRDILAFFQIVNILRKEKPDVVHLNSSKIGGLGSLAARILNLIYRLYDSRFTIHAIFTSHGLAYDEDRNLFAKFVIWKLTWFTFLLSHRVITISEDNFRRARKLPFCGNKVSLIYNGISDIDFLAKNEARKVISNHAETHADENEIWVGTISEILFNKGLPYLIESARILKEDNLKFKIFIVGEGREREEVKKLIDELELSDTVFLTGYLKNASEYLKAFDIFTLTSTKEGLPYVLLEAGLAELPVVGSNISGITDIISQGQSGLLTAPKYAEGIAQHIRALIEDEAERRKLGGNLRKRVLEKFNFQEMITKTSSLYTSR